jgi:hypothetical protein
MASICNSDTRHKENIIRILFERFSESGHLEDKEGDGSITLRCILVKWVLMMVDETTSVRTVFNGGGR